jgi:D-beta-D-heptose 7-phosphate kinase/D-beta-D-heptose 1-phosphate adenosyltransferase
MLSEKVKSITEIKNIAEYIRRRKKRIVFTNGCFDILHYGHAKYLESAKQKGDYLILGLNSDSSIRRIKGRSRPIVSQGDRAGLISALTSVDFVVIFNEDTPLNLIKKVRPDILVKGADWNKQDIVGASFVKSYGGRVETVKLVKGLSTTKLIKKIVKTLKS